MEKNVISWRSLWRIFFMLVFAAALFMLRDTLIILGLALVISAALNTPINFLEKKKIPRILAALTIFIILIVILTALIYALAPVALGELKDLSTKFNKNSFSDLREIGFYQLFKNFGANLNKYINSLFSFSNSSSFFELISSFLSNAIFMVSVFVLSFYLSLNRDGVERFLRAVLPIDYEDYTVDLYRRVRRKMSLWMGGQLILSLIIGILVFLGLLILGVNYSLTLGIVAAILEMVPFAGPIITGFITFLIAVSQSWPLAISAVILFIIIHELESNVLVPLIMKKIIGVHPVMIIIALLAGGQLAGLPGIILAIPAAIVIYEILEDWGVKKRTQ